MAARSNDDALILASASPRRRELLERIGVSIEVVPAAIDESLAGRESPEAAALRLARTKAEAVARRRRGRFVLGADTIVAIEGEILGKPADRDEAGGMLARLVGREHQVITGICVVDGEGAAAERAVCTAVSMRRAPEAEIEGYLDSGEWRGKAGAYAIQGIAAALVSEVRGSVTNVIGLPLAETLELLSRAGGPGPDYRSGRPA